MGGTGDTVAGIDQNHTMTDVGLAGTSHTMTLTVVGVAGTVIQGRVIQ